jgi:DNA-binding transcriptional LysR family regulator
MNLKKLEIYCSIVEEGSVTAAAEHFHVTQPVVSSHLRALETFFGAKLLHAEKRRMIVTEAGRAVYDYALAVRQGTETTRNFAAALAAGDAGRVVIGASHGPAGYLLPFQLAKFRAEHPRVEIELAVVGSSKVLEGLAGGLYDIGIVTSGDVPPELESEILSDEPLVLIAAPAHPLAKLRTISAASLQETDFVFPYSPRTQTWVRKCLARLDVRQPRVSMKLGSWEAIKSAVMAGAGLGLAYRFCVDAELRSKQLKALPLRIDRFTEPVLLIHSSRRRYTPMQERLFAFLRGAPNPSPR